MFLLVYVYKLDKTYETLPIGLDVAMAPETEHSAELWGNHNAGVVGSAEVRVNECTSHSGVTGLEVSTGRESLQVGLPWKKITTFSPLFHFYFSFNFILIFYCIFSCTVAKYM